jgi:hypothetical protein
MLSWSGEVSHEKFMSISPYITITPMLSIIQ